jgi:hypothetical protein
VPVLVFLYVYGTASIVELMLAFNNLINIFVRGILCNVYPCTASLNIRTIIFMLKYIQNRTSSVQITTREANHKLTPCFCLPELLVGGFPFLLDNCKLCVLADSTTIYSSVVTDKMLCGAVYIPFLTHPGYCELLGVGRIHAVLPAQ